VERSESIKAVGAAAILGLAAFFTYRFVTRGSGVSEQAFFFDVSEKKLFTAARSSVPPIRGLNGEEEDGLRALVISTNGDAADKTAWKVAYVEKYSPELKRQMQNAQQTGAAPEMGRALALQHRFVRRLSDTQWFAMDSPEAERIVSEWALPGPGGVTPVVCSP
jgi:hypothetical protein